MPKKTATFSGTEAWRYTHQLLDKPEGCECSEQKVEHIIFGDGAHYVRANEAQQESLWKAAEDVNLAARNHDFIHYPVGVELCAAMGAAFNPQIDYRGVLVNSIIVTAKGTRTPEDAAVVINKDTRFPKLVHDSLTLAPFEACLEVHICQDTRRTKSYIYSGKHYRTAEFGNRFFRHWGTCNFVLSPSQKERQIIVEARLGAGGDQLEVFFFDSDSAFEEWGQGNYDAPSFIFKPRREEYCVGCIDNISLVEEPDTAQANEELQHILQHLSYHNWRWRIEDANRLFMLATSLRQAGYEIPPETARLIKKIGGPFKVIYNFAKDQAEKLAEMPNKEFFGNYTTEYTHERDSVVNRIRASKYYAELEKQLQAGDWEKSLLNSTIAPQTIALLLESIKALTCQAKELILQNGSQIQLSDKHAIDALTEHLQQNSEIITNFVTAQKLLSIGSTEEAYFIQTKNRLEALKTYINFYSTQTQGGSPPN